MKVIIAGSRSITGLKGFDLLVKTIHELQWDIKLIISGGAMGVDLLGIQYAKDMKIPYVRYLPDWDTHGKKAGILRNKEMVEAGDALIALWDGESKGTKFTIDYAIKKGLKVHVYTTNNN